MKRFLLLGIISLLPILCFAQTNPQENDSIYKTVLTLKASILQTQNDILKVEKRVNSIQYDLKNKLNATYIKLDSLSSRVQSNTDNIHTNQVSFESQAQEIRTQSSSGIEKLSSSLSRNTLIWVLCFLIALLISIVVYLLLRKSIHVSGLKITDEIITTRKRLEEEGIKLDNKLIELLEKQLTLKHEEKPFTKVSEGPDHSLALKVADEIVRIQKNLSLMDETTKGKKQLIDAIERIRSNFDANGYEIIDMLNKPYYEGMKVKANFIPDEKIKPNEQIITRVIKPQVNYNGRMIQSAEIEVSQGIKS
jgi:hypothetical protein